MESKILLALRDWLINLGVNHTWATIFMALISLAAVLLLAVMADFLAKRIIIGIINRIARRSRNTWDDVFVEKRVFNRLSHLAPAIVVYYTAAEALAGFPGLIKLFQTGSYIYMIIITLLVIDACINAFHEIYNSLEISKGRSIKGYVQVVKIIIYIIGFLIILSVVFNKNLGFFFAGLGTMAAVLMLVFKDSLLGLVAGIQLAANDMVRLGDWIEMPSRSADGTVMDISLNTVKVKNFNNTITTIPTYAMVSESFLNWRGMEESDGRRIKRILLLDVNTIRFADKELIERISTLTGISPQPAPDGSGKVTNSSLFRDYLEHYLRNHPRINNSLSVYARYQPGSDRGMPLELYAFSRDKGAYEYERIQSGIMDHAIAMAPEFGLKVFQSLSGEDILKLGR
ncbi:MAG: mechanosensitive ion channel [Bacteroidales bacterium]